MNLIPLIDDAVRRALAEHIAINQTVTPEWLSPRQAAAYTSFTEKHLEALRGRGEGPAYSKPGKKAVRYARADLDAWMREAQR